MLKLSIIIPVYNVEKYLRTCLDSVLYPGIPDYEVFAVDDGSTDSCPEILAEYEVKYPELLKVITTENRGVGAARNEAIREAQGEYIVLLDSDDRLADGAVQEILDECDKGFDICFFDYICVNESGEIIKHLTGCNDYPGTYSLEDNPAILFELPSSTNKILRRSLFTDNNIYFPGRVWFEDFRTTPKLYIHAEKITYVKKEWYIYLQQSNSITHTNKTKRNLEIIDASEDILDYYKEHGLYEKYYPELEYAIFYNELLTSIDRVNLIDYRSEVQDQLLDYYLKKFPDYKKNRYFKAMPAKYQLIYGLIITRQYKALNMLLKANNKIKHK
jgi:Glycosyltransferases involved in cell wall biogenesis